MAQSIQLPCPHCNTEASGFVLIHWYRHPTIGNVRVVLECNVCHEPIIAAYPGGGVEEWTNGVRKVFPSEVRQLWVAPIPKIAVAPNGVPDNIASLYAQAMSSFQRQHYDAAGPLFRRIMETSIKKLHPAGKGSLYERIENLPDGIGVTQTMKKWAHRVRIIGRDAAHDEDPMTPDEVKDMQRFVEIFLVYAFEMPARLPTEITKADPPDGH